MASAGATSVMSGAFLSTLFPPTGPAAAQLPAPSQTVRLPVGALASSVPAATLVESVKFASAAFDKPDPPSLLEQASETSAACHEPSGDAQLMAGIVLSILTVSVCAASRLSALSVAK